MTGCDGAEAMSGIVRDFIALIDRLISGADTSQWAAHQWKRSSRGICRGGLV